MKADGAGYGTQVSGGQAENQDGGRDVGEGGRRTVVVGLLADPDLPTTIASKLADELPGLLEQRVDHDVTWEVEYVRDPFEALESSDRLIDKAKERVRYSNWDVAVAITDVPVRSLGAIVVADLSAEHRVGLLSLPALGGVWVRRRARDAVARIAEWLASGITGRAPTPPGEQVQVRGGGLLGRRGRVPHRVESGESDIAVEVIAGRGPLVAARLLAGMVRANRPWQLVLGLSRALAGSLAGVAFGVMYSAVWQLGAALSPPRIVAIVLGAIATLTAWLIVGHELWDRRQHSRTPVSGARLRNAGTLLTIGFGALVFFVSLFVLAFVGASVVIPPEHLEGVLGKPVGWPDYLTVALMASVLGTVAGAVGSGLEDDATVRRATYGYRERERWREISRGEQG